MRSKRNTLAPVALVVCLGAAGAMAQEEDAREREEDVIEEIVVEAEKPRSAAAAQEIRAEDYAVRPHRTTQEILNNVPGLVVSQHQGGGKAAQYFVRGFDIDHGTDLALSVDGLPVNMVTHGHGQGYADLNFVITETVDRIQLYKGPYFAEHGDLANAGAVNLVTKDEFEENFARAEGGSFATQRYVVGASPKLDWAKTMLATEAYFADGPFDDPQNFYRVNAFGKLTLDPGPESKLSVWASVYVSEWDASGQVPLREVLAGNVDRFGSVDPTEGGETDRENLNVQYTYTPTEKDRISVHAWVSRYKFKLYSNFTFFNATGLRFRREPNGTLVDTRGVDPDPSADYAPGDGIEQTDNRVLLGGTISYGRFWRLAGFPIESQIAFQTRQDYIDVALHRQVERQRFFTVNDVTVAEQSVSGFMKHDVYLASWLRVEAGLRGDVFFFDVKDQINALQGEDPNFEANHIDGTETDSIVSPKANVILTPLENTDVYFNFGTGFHSNDARVAVTSTEFEPLARSIGYEVGARTRQFDRVDVAAALWFMDLDSEFVFVGDEGTDEPSDASRRWGVDFELRYRVLDWLFADYDLTWADPRFRASGDAVPLAPTLLMNGGLTVELDMGFSAAIRARYLDNRPGIEDRTITAKGYTLVDLIAKYRWRNVEAAVTVQNLTDTDWREAQFVNPSCVRSEVGVAPGCLVAGGGEPADDIHFTPGSPIGAFGGVTVYF